MKSIYDRPPHTSPAPPRDVAHPQQGHQAGDEGEAMAVGARRNEKMIIFAGK